MYYIVTSHEKVVVYKPKRTRREQKSDSFHKLNVPDVFPKTFEKRSEVTCYISHVV